MYILHIYIYIHGVPFLKNCVYKRQISCMKDISAFYDLFFFISFFSLSLLVDTTDKRFLMSHIFLSVLFIIKTSIPLDVVHSIAIGAIQTSMNCNAAAIIITTTTGRSAVLLSIYRPRCPIVAVTRFGFVARYLNIYFAVHSVHYNGKVLHFR